MSGATKLSNWVHSDDKISIKPKGEGSGNKNVVVSRNLYAGGASIDDLVSMPGFLVVRNNGSFNMGDTSGGSIDGSMFEWKGSGYMEFSNIDSSHSALRISTSFSNKTIGAFTENAVGTLDVNGSQSNKVTEVDTATYSILKDDRTIAVDYTATGAVTLTLPTATSCWNTDGTGIAFLIKDTGANAGTNPITINRQGGDTIIDKLTGQTSTAINSNGSAIWIQAKDANTFMVY